MTTPKELADKARKLASDMQCRARDASKTATVDKLRTTIDQLQAMAEARQGSGEPVALCPCKDRPATKCPGEWEPGCDLGNNPLHARRAPPSAQQATGSGQVLTGWKFEPADGSESLIVRREGLGGYAAKKDDQNIASTILYHLASDVLAAATQAQPEGEVTRPYGMCSVTGPAEDVSFVLRNLPDVDDAAPTTGKREPLTPAERRRLWNNSPEHHADAKSIAGFERIVTLTERAHGITGEQR